MSEVKKIATRESYGNALVELGKEHEDLVVLDADDRVRWLDGVRAAADTAKAAANMECQLK